MRRLRYAIGTSLCSKITTALLQIVAFPIAIRALGDSQFVLYAMLVSAVGWLSLVNIGIGPALVVRITEAAARKDRAAEKRLFTSAIVPILTLAVLAGLGMFLAIRYAPMTSLFGSHYHDSVDMIQKGLSVLGALFLLQTVLSVVEAAQLGYQEQYVLNLMAMAGNIVSVVAIVVVAKVSPSVIGMILAVSAPPFLFRVVNATRFFVSRSFLVPAARDFSWTACRSMLGVGLVFSLAGGLGNFLCHQFPVMLAGRTWASGEAVSFAVAMNALIIASGMVSMVTISLWPAVSDGIARKEIEWVRRTHRRLLLYCTMYGLFVGTLFAVGGTALFRLWFGPSVHMTHPLTVSLGLYFVLLTWENANFAMLIGLNQITFPSLLYLIRSIFVILTMSTVLRPAGVSGPFIALCLSVLIFTLVPFTGRTMQALYGQAAISGR